MKRPVSVASLVAALCCVVIAAAAELTPGPGVMTTSSVKLDLASEWLFQHEQLARQIELREKIFLGRVTSTVFWTESLILPIDRDPADVVLRRTAALLDRISRLSGCPDLDADRDELAKLQRRAQSVDITDGLRQGRHDQYNYGVYLIDSLGNRELLYRDPAFSCHKPIPLRPRPRPPVISHGTLVGQPERAGQKTVVAKDELPKTTTVAVMNVYHGTLPFPEGTQIERLRITSTAPTKTSAAKSKARSSSPHCSDRGACVQRDITSPRSEGSVLERDSQETYGTMIADRDELSGPRTFGSRRAWQAHFPVSCYRSGCCWTRRCSRLRPRSSRFAGGPAIQYPRAPCELDRS